ncbi:MAG: hypothetical protein OXU36_12515 [Candidatus Poribacteria bacterium]|nr:hypothetical protein [Candidatus Poribacteria bacterium]
MQKRLYAIWLAVFLLSNGIVCTAYTAELKIEKTLTQADGLASNTVITIFEDSHGTMWFGMTDGLTRYDGERFQTFTTEDGLAQNTIGLIFEDQQGDLWFADGMLSSFLDRGKPMDMSYMAMPLSELAKELDNETPTETEAPAPLRGVSRYDGHAFQVFTTDDGLLRDTVKDMFEDKTGTLWLATFSGVNYYDGEKFYHLIMPGPIGMNILPDWWSQVTAIAEDTAGNFWFGSTAGITYYNTETSHFRYFGVDADFASFEEMAKAGPAYITDLQFDAKENLWMSRERISEESSGICRYDGKELVTFPLSEALPMNSVDHIMQDSKGNLWFTGVKKLPTTVRETEDRTSMVFPEVESGVSVYNGKTFQNFNTDDGLPSNRVWSVFEDSSGKLWFATDAGAAVGVYLPFEK